MKTVRFIIVGFALGLAAGLAVQSVRPSGPVVVDGQEYPPVCQMAPPVEALKNIESETDRNTEANRMMSDILKLFLADVALRMSATNQKQLSAMLPESPTCPECPACETNETSADKSDTDPVARELRRITRNERRGRDLRNPREEKAFVDGVQVENIFPYLKKTQPMRREVAESLDGVFIGEVNTNDSKRPVVQMELKLENLKVNGEKLQADMSIVLSHNGKNFSNTSGNGDISSHFKSFEGSSRAMIIEAGGGALVFQLYLVSNNQRIIGAVYKKQSVDNYSHYGSVRLTRQ